MSIVIENVSKFFNNTQVLNNISLDITSGQMVALLGPSGSGKTTLLRIIAGLEQHNSGYLRFAGKDVSRMHARDRNVGFVFQHYALFRHMTVANNIAFGLKVLPRRSRPNIEIINNKVNRLLEMIQLEHLAHRYPSQLSGGQKQRVALARALAVQPEILLLDEPFGALDAQVRKELRRWLRKLHEELKFTSVFVTHDQEEAMEVADQVVVMNNGNIEQIGTPRDVWYEPANRFVLEFMGEVNHLEGEIRDSQLFIGPHHWLINSTISYQGKVDLFLRPWELEVSKQFSIRCPLLVQIVNVISRGHYWQLTVQPLNWQQNMLTVIVSNDLIAHKLPNLSSSGVRFYLGCYNARLYVNSEVISQDKIDKKIDQLGMMYDLLNKN